MKLGIGGVGGCDKVFLCKTFFTGFYKSTCEDFREHLLYCSIRADPIMPQGHANVYLPNANQFKLVTIRQQRQQEAGFEPSEQRVHTVR